MTDWLDYLVHMEHDQRTTQSGKFKLLCKEQPIDPRLGFSLQSRKDWLSNRSILIFLEESH